MSDPSTATLTVLTSQAAQAKELFDYESSEDPQVDGPITNFIFNEVNYGDLPFLPALRNAGIAYDSNWSGGYEHEAGTLSCRFSPDGEAVEKEVYESDLNPDLDALLAVIDKPVQLRQYILDHKEKVTVPYLADANEEHGKLYRVRQLVGIHPNPEPNPK